MDKVFRIIMQESPAPDFTPDTVLIKGKWVEVEEEPALPVVVTVADGTRIKHFVGFLASVVEHLADDCPRFGKQTKVIAEMLDKLSHDMEWSHDGYLLFRGETFSSDRHESREPVEVEP